MYYATNDDPSSSSSRGLDTRINSVPAISPAARRQGRTSRPEGPAITTASNPLRFLERSHGSSSSSSNAAVNSWPAGFIPPQAAAAAARSRASTLQSPRLLPQNSSLAFLERLPRSTSVSSLVTGAGADVGLGSLSGGVVAAGASRGGFLPYPRDAAVGDTGSEGGYDDEEEDDNVCPSMIFSCFPCLACLR